MPLYPLVGIALRYGAVAVAGAIIARKTIVHQNTKNEEHEASFDQVPDGVTITKYTSSKEQQYHAQHGTWRKIWLGPIGLEIDSRVQGRFRLRKLIKGAKR